MKQLFYLLVLLLISSSCSSPAKKAPSFSQEGGVEKFQDILDKAENKASEEGRKILILSRNMIASKERIPGSCWNYINTVFNRAGNTSSNRSIVFKGKLSGPYANAKLIQQGDWLYYVNHSYKGVEHSGIFVEWTNFKQKKALMMSYAGEKRNTAARYKVYDLSNVFHVTRPD